MDQTASDRHADEFFARYTNATSETIAGLQQEAHPDGDIDQVVAEATNYWNRLTRARSARARAVTDYSDPFTNRDETARRPYASPEALAALPAPAYAKQPLEDRYTAAVRANVFWTYVAKPENRDRIAAKARAAFQRTMQARIRAEEAAVKRAVTLRRDAQRAAVRQARLQRTLQRIGHLHAARQAADLRHRANRLRTEIHPAGITLDRAFEIAMRLTPPQAPR